MMMILLSFETEETLNPTRQHNIPEDSNLQQHHHNPKHHTHYPLNEARKLNRQQWEISMFHYQNI